MRIENNIKMIEDPSSKYIQYTFGDWLILRNLIIQIC